MEGCLKFKLSTNLQLYFDDLLKEGEICVCKIVEALSLSQSLVSHHLKDLKEAGLVQDKKQGLWVYYSLTNKGKSVTNLLFRLLKGEKYGNSR